MPRIAEPRDPAEPTSSKQKRRYEDILRAAAAQGAAKGLEGVQMQEIAKDAGVAIATLYRYFPSKTQLFTAVLRAQVVRLGAASVAADPGMTCAEAVAELLLRALRQLLRQPRLALAMLQANNASVADQSSFEVVNGPFRTLILRVAGIDAPTEQDQRLVRLLQQTWYGILVSTLNGHITSDEAEDDTRMACQLLLTRLGEPGEPAATGGSTDSASA